MNASSYTCGITLWGKFYKFKRSKKPLGCEDCDLRNIFIDPKLCDFEGTCKHIKKLWPIYKYGVFKKDKK